MAVILRYILPIRHVYVKVVKVRPLHCLDAPPPTSVLPLFELYSCAAARVLRFVRRGFDSKTQISIQAFTVLSNKFNIFVRSLVLLYRRTNYTLHFEWNLLFANIDRPIGSLPSLGPLSRRLRLMTSIYHCYADSFIHTECKKINHGLLSNFDFKATSRTIRKPCSNREVRRNKLNDHQR